MTDSTETDPLVSLARSAALLATPPLLVLPAIPVPMPPDSSPDSLKPPTADASMGSTRPMSPQSVCLATHFVPLAQFLPTTALPAMPPSTSCSSRTPASALLGTTCSTTSAPSAVPFAPPAPSPQFTV